MTFSCSYVRTITKKVGKDGTESTDSQGASLKGCHPVQNEGATITYLKRYLYLNAFEISEADVLDATMNPNVQNPAPKKDKKPFKEVIAQFNKNNVLALLGEFGYESVDEIPKYSQAEFYNRLKNI